MLVLPASRRVENEPRYSFSRRAVVVMVLAKRSCDENERRCSYSMVVVLEIRSCRRKRVWSWVGKENASKTSADARFRWWWLVMLANVFERESEVVVLAKSSSSRKRAGMLVFEGREEEEMVGK